MTTDIGVRFLMDKDLRKWMFTVETDRDLDDMSGITIMFLSLIRFAESYGVDKDALVDALIENLDDDAEDVVELKRELPGGVA